MGQDGKTGPMQHSLKLFLKGLTLYHSPRRGGRAHIWWGPGNIFFLSDRDWSNSSDRELGGLPLFYYLLGYRFIIKVCSKIRHYTILSLFLFQFPDGNKSEIYYELSFSQSHHAHTVPE